MIKYLTKYLTLLYVMLECRCLKYCVNCKYFKAQFNLPYYKEFGKCTLFPKTTDNHHLVTGKKQEVDHQYCSIIRQYECGEEGKFYTEK